MSEPSDGVGSLAEEAAKLLGALSGLAREQGADLGEGLSSLTDKAAAAAHDLEQHIATGGEDCVYCPVCRAIHLVRQTSPEVRAHLAVAASSLVQAAAGMLATSPTDGRRSRDGVEHIDLDGDVSMDDLDEPDPQGDR